MMDDCAVDPLVFQCIGELDDNIEMIVVPEEEDGSVALAMDMLVDDETPALTAIVGESATETLLSQYRSSMCFTNDNSFDA